LQQIIKFCLVFLKRLVKIALCFSKFYEPVLGQLEYLLEKIIQVLAMLYVVRLDSRSIQQINQRPDAGIQLLNTV